MKDDEGYSCALSGGEWIIIDRYSRRVESERSHDRHDDARSRADAINEDVLTRRFDDV